MHEVKLWVYQLYPSFDKPKYNWHLDGPNFVVTGHRTGYTTKSNARRAATKLAAQMNLKIVETNWSS